MAGFLEGEIAKAVYKGFKGKLLKGVLTRTVPGDTLDDFGDPITSAPITYDCEGFVENFSAFYRQQAGIPETDVKAMIFAQSISTEPTIEDKLTFRGVTYQVRKIIEIDPAIATYTLQVFKL